jgi:Tfp pilus assembly protein PilW
MFFFPLQPTSYKLQPSFGFTLIELLLYVTITGMVLLGVSVFFAIQITARIQHQTISEVESQGVAVMQIISQTVRNAETITSPTQGLSTATTTLDVVTVAKDPTLFDLTAGVIRITEGTSTVLALTNSRVTASDLSFQNVSRNNTPGTLRVQFTLTHINNEGRKEYDYAQTFYETASLRY